MIRSRRIDASGPPTDQPKVHGDTIPDGTYRLLLLDSSASGSPRLAKTRYLTRAEIQGQFAATPRGAAPLDAGVSLLHGLRAAGILAPRVETGMHG